MRLKVNQLRGLAPVILAVLLGQVSLSFAQQQSVDQSSSSGVISPVGGSGSDSLNFQADLFTGRFTYSVPIKVAPGRQGAQPKLVLGYNSASGNGWCGVGWNLDVGYIQRDVRHGVPISWGSTNPLPQYDDSKGFLVNMGGGVGTLVRVSGTNQNPIVYRQQVDVTFLTYNYYTNNHWEVVDKSGDTFYFGEGITNQMENIKTNWPQGVGSSTFRWALDKVIDANGNESFLRYTTDDGVLYLTNIAYNANVNSPGLAATHTIDFILTNRPDTNITFIGGYRMQTHKLLSEIDVKVSGANVRKYSLGYTVSPSTMRSLLASVTEYGSDYSTALPPITFNYQIESFTFGSLTNWFGTRNSATSNTMSGWEGIRSGGIDTVDIDGDGLIDYGQRHLINPNLGNNSAYASNYLYMVRNTGNNFTPGFSNFIHTYLDILYPSDWGRMNCQNQELGSTNGSCGSMVWLDFINYDWCGYTILKTIDINGDGYPDRVMRKGYNGPYTNWVVQLNDGTMSFGSYTTINWGPVTNDESMDAGWLSIQNPHLVDFLDMNGDGLPDRVMRKVNSPYDRFKVQLNTGTGFTGLKDWYPLDSQGNTDSTWNSLSQSDSSGNMEVILVDINGDGLPDRVMRQINNPYTNFVVQFNNGAGFEPAENWGPLNSQGQSSLTWNSPIGSDGSNVWSTLIDINGDGLPDRVMRTVTPPYTNWVVQLNTGSGFGPPVVWGNVNSQGQPTSDWSDISAKASASTYVDFFDINGDGLPDRVMRAAQYPYDHFVVQLNQGPFPDLLNVVSNGLGGSVQVSYIASTTLNNRDKDWVSDPWLEGAKSLLPFNVWVVSQITTSDGMGNISTNSYSFKGGYYNTKEKEFRGFSQVAMTDSLGAKTITYFHQSDGRDNSALGEYLDQGSESKKGIPFRTDVIGSDGATNQITLNKVEEVMLNSNGWYFPFISQTITMNYEGLSSYRATAKQFNYDTNTEYLLEEIDLGEVTNVIFQGQTFTDVGSDSVYTWMSYANLGNILEKPSDIKITSDSAGANRLRETLMSYDSCGNLTANQVWLDTAGTYVTMSSVSYDQYGNPIQATDASGITTTSIYDSTYKQYAIAHITGTFTNQFAYDARAGLVLTATDAKGLVASNTFDVFFRGTANYMSTNAYGSPTLWKAKIFYSLGGISGGISSNYVHKQVNDAVDTVNGFETYTYFDGLSRAIQTRVEAETTGQFRVANACYDLRGKPYFQTLPYFSSGTGFTTINGPYLGTLTEYDSIGRAFRVTSAVQGNFINGSLQSTIVTGGDSGSPDGSMTTAFVDGNNPWASVATNSEGKITKSCRDAYGRVTTITEVTANGNFTTHYNCDLLGNLTNVIDNANNSTMISNDSLGRKISMIDPDMGTWSYSYDNAGRMTKQIDARGNKLTFNYNDPLGRVTSKQIYNCSNFLVGTVTFTYDTSDDPNYTVFKGQLYKVTDQQGYERSSYDVRGRNIKSARYLKLNSMEYVTQTTYDDADRVQQITYPGNAAIIQYNYGTAGNLIQVKSLAGTGTQEIFYTPQGFNEIGQLTGYTNGNNDVTLYTYYSNSKRPQNVLVKNGTTALQNLSYTYDTVSDLKSINDGVYSGTASASVSSITYDDLNRVTSLNSTARGIKAYAYNSIGNILTNQDFGLGVYGYGSKPHAVTSANGVNYAYDACGNMTTRGNQTLTYDEQNQLIQVFATNTLVNFGYNDAGERLWRCGTNGYTVWIGNIYEINNGKVLCHVMAGGKRIATFESQCGGLWSKAFGEKNWYVASTTIQSVLNWPFQKGRGQMTMFAGMWMAILSVCVVAGRKVRLKHYEVRKTFQPLSLWKRAVTFVSLSAFLWASTGNVEAATYNPVFYYYHNDNLGSSNVLTDRSGSLVQHYEYATFGQTTFTDNTSAFPISNRYTGQILDDETGLYYYNARYYDPQLGRFIQPDTTIPSLSNPQTLNRYTYVDNNPLNNADPSGHFFFVVLFFAMFFACVSVNIAGIVDAIENKTMSENAFWGAFAAGGVGGLIGGAGLGFIGAIAGGAAAGAVSSAIQGGDVGMGALTGAIGGAIGFGFAQIPLPGGWEGNVFGFALGTAGGALGGAATAELYGGDVGEGAANGAAEGAIGSCFGMIDKNSETGLPEDSENAEKVSSDAYTHPPGEGFADVGVKYGDYKDGFAAILEKIGDTYYMGNRGTRWWSLSDWCTNIEQAFGLKTEAYEEAVDLARRVYEATGHDVIFVGHSLGGGLAAAEAEATGGSAITFNAAGLSSRYANGHTASIQNYFIRGDILTTFQTFTPFPSAAGTQIGEPGGLHLGIGDHLLNRFSGF